MEMNLTRRKHSVEIAGIEKEDVKELIYKLDTYDNQLVEGVENIKILANDNELLDYLKENNIKNESISDKGIKIEYTLILKLEKGDNDVNFVDKEGTNNKINDINKEISDIIKSFDLSRK